MRFLAILRLRCPRCLTGRVFHGLFRMQAECPQCQLRFEREPGYFFGAMYFSYGMGVIAAAPLGVYLAWRGVAMPWIAAALVVELALLAPLLFRYARVLWLHFDQVFDPR